MEQEVWATLLANMSDLSEVEHKLAQLDGVLAQDETLRPQARVVEMRTNQTKLANIILSKNHLTQKALSERARRKFIESRLTLDASVRDVQPRTPTLPTPAETAALAPGHHFGLALAESPGHLVARHG